jgi:hypothetical protein
MFRNISESIFARHTGVTHRIARGELGDTAGSSEAMLAKSFGQYAVDKATSPPAVSEVGSNLWKNLLELSLQDSADVLKIVH